MRYKGVYTDIERLIQRIADLPCVTVSEEIARTLPNEIDDVLVQEVIVRIVIDVQKETPPPTLGVNVSDNMNLGDSMG